MKYLRAEKTAKPLHSHGFGFKMERYFAAAMVPLFPAAYFIHGPTMDAMLTFALTLHIHWGVYGVISVSFFYLKILKNDCKSII